MKTRSFPTFRLFGSLTGGVSFYCIIFGILHLAIPQHELPFFWGWIFIGLGAVLLVIMVLMTIGIVKIVKREKESTTEKIDVDVGIQTDPGLVLGLLLITYFAPLIGPGATLAVWLAFITGIIIAATRILKNLARFIKYGAKAKAEELKKKYAPEETSGKDS